MKIYAFIILASVSVSFAQVKSVIASFCKGKQFIAYTCVINEELFENYNNTDAQIAYSILHTFEFESECVKRNPIITDKYKIKLLTNALAKHQRSSTDKRAKWSTVSIYQNGQRIPVCKTVADLSTVVGQGKSWINLDLIPVYTEKN
jgi:hypothetical protein